MRRSALTLIAVMTLATSGLGAQESARDRARRTLPPDVFQEVSALAEDMAVSGVPDEPLFMKALEGMARRYPRDRWLPAVRELAGRLREARLALGPTAGIPLLKAGADAIQNGVPTDALRSLPSDRPRSATDILVLTELVESGVPTDRALALLREANAQRTRDDRVLDIPARVRALIRDGVAPQDAVDRVRRILQRDRGGSVGPPVPPGSEPVTRDRLSDRLRRRSG